MLIFLRSLSLWKISSARHEDISQMTISIAKKNNCCGNVLYSVATRLKIAHLQTGYLSTSVESDEMQASVSDTTFLDKILTSDMGKSA